VLLNKTNIMKTKITILGLAILMISCNTNESKMKSGIKDYFKKNAKDPGSYEFVELKITDTITVGEIAQKFFTDNEEEIKKQNDDIEFQKKLIKDFPSLPSDEQKTKIKSNEEFIVELKNDMDKVKPFINNKEVALYNVEHSYRLKNGFGALDLYKHFFAFDKEFKLIDMAKEETDLSHINKYYCWKNYFDKK